VSILGRGVQLDLDTRALSISWKIIVCGANTTSEDPFWSTRVPTQCKPYDKAIDVYLNEYVLVPSTAQLPLSATTSAFRLLVSPSLSKPIFSFVPHTDLIGKELR